MSDKLGFGIGSGSLGAGSSFGSRAPGALPSTEKQTTVEEGTTFKGSLSSTCPVVVKGRIEGDVAAPSLHVSASGAVHGKVKVTELRSAGELSGEFDADVAQLSGRVRDKTVIRAKQLEVKLAPQSGKMELLFGECNLEVGEAPKEEAARTTNTKGVGSGVSVPPAASTSPTLSDTKEEKSKKGRGGDKASSDTDEHKAMDAK